MKFSIVDFFSECDQILRKLRIWSHLLKKPLRETLIYTQCSVISVYVLQCGLDESQINIASLINIARKFGE